MWTSEDWPATFDRSQYPVLIRTADTNRGTEVAELALAHVLVGLKRLRQIPKVGSLRSFVRTLLPRTAGEAVGAHNWMRMKTGTLYRKTVGIVGYGLIGHEIRRRLSGFGCEVDYFHSHRFSPVIESQLSITWSALEELFARADVVIVQLPLNDRTTACIDSAILRRARPGLVLVNCGRAGVIDRQALEQWLRFDRTAYYGADVFWKEPTPAWDRLRFRRNVFITPHMAESVYAENDVDGRMIHQLQNFMGEIHVESSLR
jgi:phosphoglycerate dehydrogenase-like enzyme